MTKLSSIEELKDLFEMVRNNVDDSRLQIIKTGDGSPTLYVSAIDEHYHSVNGAVQESMHVFIEAGLKYFNESEITIFEMGFGTGLNAYLTWDIVQSTGQKVYYHGLEKYPLEEINDFDSLMVFCRKSFGMSADESYNFIKTVRGLNG